MPRDDQTVGASGPSIDSHQARISTPCPADILLGRGRPFQGHPGNRLMLELVDNRRVAYHDGGREDKNRLIVEVMQILKSKGGKFLRRVDYEDYWVEVSHAISYRKVGHAFRSTARVGRTSRPRVDTNSTEPNEISSSGLTTSQPSISNRIGQVTSLQAAQRANTRAQEENLAESSESHIPSRGDIGSTSEDLINRSDGTIPNSGRDQSDARLSVIHAMHSQGPQSGAMESRILYPTLDNRQLLLSEIDTVPNARLPLFGGQSQGHIAPSPNLLRHLDDLIFLERHGRSHRPEVSLLGHRSSTTSLAGLSIAHRREVIPASLPFQELNARAGVLLNTNPAAPAMENPNLHLHSPMLRSGVSSGWGSASFRNPLGVHAHEDMILQERLTEQYARRAGMGLGASYFQGLPTSQVFNLGMPTSIVRPNETRLEQKTNSPDRGHEKTKESDENTKEYKK